MVKWRSMFCGLTLPSISGRTRKLLEKPAVNCSAIETIPYLVQNTLRTLLQGLEQFFGFNRHFHDADACRVTDRIANRRCDRENSALAHTLGTVWTPPATLL